MIVTQHRRRLAIRITFATVVLAGAASSCAKSQSAPTPVVVEDVGFGHEPLIKPTPKSPRTTDDDSGLPTDARAYYRRAQASLDAGRLAEARGFFEATARKFPYSRAGTESGLRVADIDFALGDFLRAAEEYRAWAYGRSGYYGDVVEAAEMRAAILGARKRADIAECRARAGSAPCIADEHDGGIPSRPDPTIARPPHDAGGPEDPERLHKVP